MTIKPKKNPCTYIPARANRAERDLRKIARVITTQEALDHMMMQMRPEMREPGFERLKPYLSFPAVSKDWGAGAVAS